MSIKLASALPKGTANGLEPIVLPLCAEPERYQVVLAIVDCKEIKTDTDTGEVIPTMRIRRIEAITGLDKPAARRMIERATERRTGRTELPFEMEADLTNAFGAEAGN
ncbi:MAG: hypothetical protein YHS30scaffold324_30 [Catenulispora phage 69_17]|jgi:hypothetical protein|nr:MAG: hypothetical protein YHS30scaffold324_30 [Catenulispora phage 69_17]